MSLSVSIKKTLPDFILDVATGRFLTVAVKRDDSRPFLLNFDSKWRNLPFRRQRERKKLLTIKNDYDIVLNCVSMDPKPLPQQKCRKHGRF